MTPANVRSIIQGGRVTPEFGRPPAVASGDEFAGFLSDIAVAVAAYREAVLPDACRRRVAIEAGITDFWRKYVGLDGAVVGIDRFGASAPAEKLFPHFGFTVDKVVEAARALD